MSWQNIGYNINIYLSKPDEIEYIRMNMMCIFHSKISAKPLKISRQIMQCSALIAGHSTAGDISSIKYN